MKNLLKFLYTITTFECVACPPPSQSESVYEYVAIVTKYASDHFPLLPRSHFHMDNAST